MNALGQADEASVLKFTLHGRLVGYLAGFNGGRNVLSFADEFRNDIAISRLTLHKSRDCVV